MHSQGKFKYWRRKKPTEANTRAKAGYCLSDHFHRSGLEVRVCDELRLRKLGGDIRDFKVEVTFQLELGGVKLGTYRADFVVDHFDGITEVIEAKGLFFPVFKQKWKIFEGMHRDNPLMKLTIITK